MLMFFKAYFFVYRTFSSARRVDCLIEKVNCSKDLLIFADQQTKRLMLSICFSQIKTNKMVTIATINGA